MRAPIKWLKDYVEIDQTPEDLANMLTMAGIPVEGITYLGKNIEGVVTGKIQSIDPHQGADKLSICKVDIVSEILTIVTGATNIEKGDIVPVATVGAKLPTGQEIGRTDIRGVVSEGMLCSIEELAIDNKLVAAEARNGIFILPPDTPAGIDAKEALGLDDVVLEFELTANRADCFSIIGLAREIAALTSRQLRKPMLTLKEAAPGKAPDLAKISISDSGLCQRYAARIIQDICIKPSPAWLRNRIFAAGVRPINNVVDVTNFVMLETGQPLHAFDYNLLGRHSIVVRNAYEGEKITTLDNAQRTLNKDTIVVADAATPVAIAGVMGGLATEVTANTKNVLLESASFKSSSVRKTSRELGLRSEASGRFERGVDVVNIIAALDRAANILENMEAGKICEGVIDVYPQIQMPTQITFTSEQINEYLGTDISKETMLDYLDRLGFHLNSKDEQITLTAPSWRLDVTCMADISEEIARMYGYDNIPLTTPSIYMTKAEQSHTQSIVDRVKETLTGIGFFETISFSFTHPSIFDKLNIPPDSNLRKAIDILNPITEDFPILRTALTGSLLETVASNFSQKNEDLKLYEVGTVYLPNSLPLQDFPREELMLTGILTGRRHNLLWNQPQETVDFNDIKGVAETILESLGISECKWLHATSAPLNNSQISKSLLEVRQHPSLHPGKSLQLQKDGDILGYLGEVHPAVLDSFELKRKVYIFELSIDLLAKHACLIKQYTPLPKFPAISRDLSLIVPEAISSEQIKQAIIQSGGTLLTNVTLFDVYAGDQVPKGSKSMAFSLIFRASGRTLTDEEIEEHYKEIVTHLEKTLAAKLRM